MNGVGLMAGCDCQGLPREACLPGDHDCATRRQRATRKRRPAWPTRPGSGRGRACLAASALVDAHGCAIG